MRILAIALCASGCDYVFGLDHGPAPCSVASFASATPTALMAADAFSISWDQTLVVYTQAGFAFEQALPHGTPMPIDLGIYVPESLALTPEGDALFFSAAIEPPLLQTAVRASPGAWDADAIRPRGVFAGTPSADEFGARRVLVRLRDDAMDVQEYVDDGGKWQPTGDPHVVATTSAPNLSASGLDMTFTGVDADNAPGVFVAHRSSTAEWFDDPVVILPGQHASPQLLGSCTQLYVDDDGMVSSYAN